VTIAPSVLDSLAPWGAFHPPAESPTSTDSDRHRLADRVWRSIHETAGHRLPRIARARPAAPAPAGDRSVPGATGVAERAGPRGRGRRPDGAGTARGPGRAATPFVGRR